MRVSNNKNFQAKDFGPKRKNRSRYELLDKSGAVRTILIDRTAILITVDSRDKVQVLKNYSILIKGGVIKKVARGKLSRNGVDLVYDANQRGGIVVTPGFINCHAHPPMYLLRSSMTLDKEDLESSLVKMAKLEQAMTTEDFYLGALGDFSEEQKNGITTTFSHYGVFDPIEKAAKITHQRVINAFSPVSNSHPKNTIAMLKKILAKKSHVTTPAIALHYPHKATMKQLKELAAIQKKHKLLVTMHAVESKNLAQACIDVHGLPTAMVLDKVGLLNSRTILSHAIHFTDIEVKLLAKRKVGIAHLPTSNRLHNSGNFDYVRFYKAGMANRIALGTDSVISKNSLDLLTEALQTRITHMDKMIIYYEDLFKMMTTNAARILGLSKVGRIAPGFVADLCFWKLKDRGFLPYNEQKPISLVGNMITHGGRNIRDLMINGEFIITNRVHNLIDESELLVKLQTAHTALRKRYQGKNK
ncbi:MAG: hypothetical protein COT81_05335 [Candidatus Buchananbacteria bacterium CG10_big_fil_rev_8_21_14_0_10_42_9]|uniref:Amidohydrolase-related domain-containing protein n=1 Tax=Candidatus Buchananbacteria bacterium CG10_big_fil_rev_8_21_14_0_10_42_9 TaxID=1974526 RepID=A0A2H0W2F2_9BACT|nr:MAG: hypothetical protein COT81_05335 [Candidatus Buchananbacteria bacterium CG10_big_fil_rev_8_21_14_0_10_42_9]